MKKWNTIGYGKAIFIAIFAVFSFIEPIYSQLKSVGLILTATIGALIGSALFATLIIYIIVIAFNGNITIPYWNDNPMSFRKPAIYLQFAGIAAIIFGVANLLGVYIKYSDLSIFGVQYICSGIGVLLSIKLSRKLNFQN